MKGKNPCLILLEKVVGLVKQRSWRVLNVESVIVACSETEVFDLISSLGGKAIMTNPNLPSGTDRIFDALKDETNAEKYDCIINLQGDMPIINSKDIMKVSIPLKQGFDIGTLVTNLSFEEEKNNNITKAKINWIKKNYLGKAIDFYKISKKDLENVYHHVGIYSFSFKSLKKFVDLEPSSNEKNHSLEQLRAIDAKMKIGVNYIENVPLSVDTKDDLINVENIINNNNDQ